MLPVGNAMRWAVRQTTAMADEGRWIQPQVFHKKYQKKAHRHLNRFNGKGQFLSGHLFIFLCLTWVSVLGQWCTNLCADRTRDTWCLLDSGHLRNSIIHFAEHNLQSPKTVVICVLRYLHTHWQMKYQGNVVSTDMIQTYSTPTGIDISVSRVLMSALTMTTLSLCVRLMSKSKLGEITVITNQRQPLPFISMFLHWSSL